MFFRLKLRSRVLTVFSYQNQREVGAGIKKALQDVPGLKREDLFIVSWLAMFIVFLNSRSADLQVVEQPAPP